MNKNIRENVDFTTAIKAMVFFVAGAFALSIIFVYVFGYEGNASKRLSKFLPYPAAVVDWKGSVTIGDFNENIESVKRFYENQDFSKINLRIDFSTEDGKKRLKIKEKDVLNKMIEDKAIQVLAERRGIKITQSLVDENVERKLLEYGTKDAVEKNLMRLYGWTLDDFKEKIVMPSMYKDELEKSFNEEDDSEILAREKIEQAEKALQEGKSFEDVAREYSEGSTAEDGGALGWFKKEFLAKEIVEDIFSLKIGETSKILESNLGMHIVRLEDKKEENGETIVNIRQIFVAKKTFADWLGEEMKEMKFLILLRDFRWDRSDSVLKFRDEEMEKFEKNAIENSFGDPSILF